MEATNNLKPNEICSTEETAEEEEVIGIKTEAENLNNANGKLMGDSRHQNVESIYSINQDNMNSKEVAVTCDWR